MFGWLFGKTTDSILSSTSTDDADVLYAGTVNTATRRKTVEQLDNDNFAVTDITPQDIDNLEDQTIFYRHKMFTSGMNQREQQYTVAELKRAEEESNVDFIQDPDTAFYHKDKNRTAEYLDQAFEDIENVRMAEGFDSEEALEILEEDEIVAKPSRSCCGNGVKKIDDSEVLEDYIEDLEEDQYRLEEAIPHDEEYKDCRAVVIGDGEEATVLEVAARQDGNGFANNISNGGEYADSGEIFDYEIDAALKATEGLEVAAFDYMKTPDNEIIGLEVNSDMGTAINEEYSEEIDINSEITRYIESRTDEDVTYNAPDTGYAEHLDVTQTRQKELVTPTQISSNPKQAQTAV